MANTKYIEIKGHSIQATDTDPVLYAGAWSSGNNLNTGRGQGFGSGSQTAAIVAGGNTGGSPAYTAVAEQYDGSSWSEVSDLDTARSGSGGSSGLAPYTATIVFGGEVSGSNTAVNEYYDGSSWTELSALNTARSYFG